MLQTNRADRRGCWPKKVSLEEGVGFIWERSDFPRILAGWPRSAAATTKLKLGANSEGQSRGD
jgi:hypothetical protein